jgi:hypothetical protein
VVGAGGVGAGVVVVERDGWVCAAEDPHAASRAAQTARHVTDRLIVAEDTSRANK